MARVILDVPNEKMQPFLQAILNLGLERHAISSAKFDQTKVSERRKRRGLRQLISTYLLFDWEFFSNELEYE
ncbi:MAG: hypothetical protein HYI21_01985 [Sediminibacterium sp. Gen4]|jgi:hypothetical protein|uniref:hypothetical protein n=1 Tax=unclassified Sediminibacterium TaxID=2635961 RepID=UPI0015BBB077|nr:MULTISPECIES: hypothetical protein [unclassified Sediminibacterium]MBW0161520.1 hypothetical protein [Sediminibacterium sp.]MBW0165809.1 hypothetical protein [Sediminibacterium sp.]NWK64776.1 hypothetical protein [Sediminibacterium sp. Gen4]